MKRQEIIVYLVGGIIMLTGLAILVDAMIDNMEDWKRYAIGGGILFAGAIVALFSERLTKISVGGATIELRQQQYFESVTTLTENVQKKELAEEDREERASYAETKSLPGQAAPDFTAVQLAKVNKLLVRPSAYPMTPMYLLDKDYRILDWNEAFSLAFDRTMEGRQGHGVLEWTYNLDNYQDVLDHGEKVFADPDKLPPVDVEDVVYTSLRYGRIEAIKRAYQIPDDNGECLAWLITMELNFTNPKEKSRYRYELLRIIGLDQLWSEYAISYDRILTNTRVYRDLINYMLGNSGPLAPIDSDAKILDLGASTGNISLRLMDGTSNLTVFALDSNRVMLEFLRDKCRGLLREDDHGPGIIAIKQDVTSLFGLPKDYFDCIIANNVFYALADPEASLEACLRVLKPGGELRMSGPRKDTDLDILFNRIRSDLKNAGKFKEYQTDFDHVEQINRFRLKTMLHRWSTQDFCTLLEEAGFQDIHSSEKVYAGQSMLITAPKPPKDTTDIEYAVARRA